jgi:hypothetical protein
MYDDFDDIQLSRNRVMHGRFASARQLVAKRALIIGILPRACQAVGGGVAPCKDRDVVINAHSFLDALGTFSVDLTMLMSRCWVELCGIIRAV